MRAVDAVSVIWRRLGPVCEVFKLRYSDRPFGGRARLSRHADLGT